MLGDMLSIKKIENRRTDFWVGLITIIIIILLRIVFESVEIYDKLYLSSSQVLHYFLFFISIFLSFFLTLTLIIRDKIQKTFNVSCFFYAVILIVPLIDMIFSKGQGIVMKYFHSD